MKRQFQRHSGFTLVELMVVLVIIGILIAVALPHFASASDRAKMAAIKSNMKVTQTMVETYGVDYGGIYPDTRNALATEAKAKGYWKDFYNPYTQKLDPVKDTTMISGVEDLAPGMVVYFGSGTPSIEDVAVPSPSSYTIYGLILGENGEVDLVRKRGRERFYLTNS